MNYSIVYNIFHYQMSVNLFQSASTMRSDIQFTRVLYTRLASCMTDRIPLESGRNRWAGFTRHGGV